MVAHVRANTNRFEGQMLAAVVDALAPAGVGRIHSRLRLALCEELALCVELMTSGTPPHCVPCGVGMY